MDVKDSNGAVLKDGDNVILIKDLKVKGTSATLKRGTLVKGIRLTDDPDEVECRVEKIKGLVLRTEFLKKAASRSIPDTCLRRNCRGKPKPGVTGFGHLQRSDQATVSLTSTLPLVAWL